jgi:hypothetical protein
MHYKQELKEKREAREHPESVKRAQDRRERSACTRLSSERI